ncbi:MAG: ribosome-binding ATPase YchF [Acidimicrobiales bacterium]|nr:MAG: ribosome-binding ATPase YchF [Acidimicrobiales bacterium]
MQSYGLVGYPNAGKTSLFNALTRSSALAAPYPFATTDPNVGVVAAPDRRLVAIHGVARSERCTPAMVRFVDIGGLVEGAHRGEGLGNRFLAAIREVDAVCLVLRCFRDPEVPGSADPLEQLAVLEAELCLADLEVAGRALEKRKKAAVQDKSLSAGVELLERAVEHLDEGDPLWRTDLVGRVRDDLSEWGLVTARPVICVLNVGEGEVPSHEVVSRVGESLGHRPEVVDICVRLELEAASLTQEERRELLAAYGVEADALERFLGAATRVLDLGTFFTANENETRAWIFPSGTPAVRCAGMIHSDMEKRFVKADVLDWETFVEFGGWPAAARAGLVRSEGRDYLVRDGEVLQIRFGR